jgi:protein-disulfide isomerase
VKILTRYCLGAMVAIMCSMIAGTASAEITEKEKQEIVDMVIDRLKNDPAIALEMLGTLKKSARGNTEDAQSVMKSAPRMIELTEGNPEGDIIIMDFSDYGCSACNSQSKEILIAAKANNRVKIVLRDLPLSGDDALQASIDLVSAASGQKEWRKIRNVYLSGNIKPEMRIVALATEQSYPSEADRELAKIALEKNKTLAERSGIENGPAAIMIHGENVQLLPTPVTSEQIADIIKALETKSD